MIGMSENMSKKRKIIISVTLVTIVVLGLLLLIPVLNNTVNITKAEQAETSKLESDTIFQNAYYDEKTGEVVGLTEEEQKILDKILTEVKEYLEIKGIDSKIEKIANNEIEVTLENVSEEQANALGDEIIQTLAERIQEELGDVITDEMVISIQSDGKLDEEVTEEVKGYIVGLGGGLNSFVKSEIIDSLDDEIEDELTKFIISNAGQNMAMDILSGNVSDVFSNYGDLLMDSVSGGIKDLVNFKISDKIFGDVDDSLKILLGDQLDIVGRAGDIIGLDLNNVIGLPDKLLGNVVGDLTGSFSNKIGGALVGDISDGITTYMDSIGQGITDTITGGLVEGVAEIGGIPGIGKEKGTERLAWVENPNPTPEKIIPQEELENNEYLFCTLHGQHIPSNTVSLGSRLVDQDATLHDFPQYLGTPIFKTVQDLPRFIGRKGEDVGLEYPNLTSLHQVTTNIMGIVLTNPPANIFSKKAVTHTLGVYSNKLKELTPVEAYVLAHDKHIGAYPDYVQRALWYVLEYLGISAPKSPEVDNSRDPYMWGETLADEAIGLDEALTALKTFTASNSGKILVDKTNYWMNYD